MVKYKLATPVEFDGKVYEELEFPRPKGKHLKSIPGDPCLGDVMKVAMKICNVPNKVFEEMDGYDYSQVGDILNDFLSVCPKTSRKSLPQ